MQKKLENYVIFFRKITSDFRNRVITLDEMHIHNWLRLNANTYGITITSLADISTDLFRAKKSENYINKILLSLKRKKYLYYHRRTGRRGSFEVHFGDFILPTKQITTLGGFFETEKGRTLGADGSIQKSELEQNLSGESQNLKSLKNDIKSLASNFSVNGEVRTRNNDNNKEKNISTSFKEGTNLSDFKPKNLDEELCLNVATYLGEKDINFVLSVLKKHGRGVIEKALRNLKEVERKTKIKNRGAYFNSLIKKNYGKEN